jgi:hypothetical protein
VNGLFRGGNKSQNLDQTWVRYHKLRGPFEEFIFLIKRCQNKLLKSRLVNDILPEASLAGETPFREVLFSATDVGVLPSRESRDPVVDPHRRHIDP